MGFDWLLSPLRGIAEGPEHVDLLDRSEREIVGVQGTCFALRSTVAGGGESEMCFSQEGLLLFLRLEEGGRIVTVEATSVSTDVTDQDFELPYEILQ